MVALHVVLTLLAMFVSAFIGILIFIPQDSNLARFDSLFYHSIATRGYYADFETGGGNTGFFPMFPWIWNALNTGFLGVSIFNICLTLLSIIILSQILEIRSRLTLLFMSLPSFVFFYLPLSEAAFFLFSSLIIIGLFRKNDWLTAAGLLLASMTRPSSVVFIPAILIMVLWLRDAEVRTKWRQTFLWTISSLTGLFLVVLFQFYKTGIWLVYFQTQRIHAKRLFSIPSLNFTTWGFKNLWIDGFGLWCGVIASVFILLTLLHRVKPSLSLSLRKYSDIPSHVWFSILYVAGISMLNILANPKIADGRTTLMAENRYVLASPFFYVAFSYFIANSGFISKKWIVWLMGSMALLILTTMEYNGFPELKYFFKMTSDLPIFIYAFGVLFYFIAISLYKSPWVVQEKYSREVWVALYIINLFLQVHAFQRFMSDDWVG